MKKKIILFLLSSSSFLILFIIIILACMMCFEGEKTNTDDYVESNIKYAARYINTLNKNIKIGNGYVPLNRIIYFYNANTKLSFDEIYEDNLDKDLKQMKPISEVCNLEKYKDLSICSIEYLDKSNQVDYIQIKPFTPPLKTSNMNVTSFFKQQRVVYGNYNVHHAWDFSSPAKTIVYSSCKGKVTYISFNFKLNNPGSSGGGGNQIRIQCDKVDNEVYIITYMHLYPFSNKVQKGDEVIQNQPIAEVGTTGYSTGNHLHFQVNNNSGNVVDGMSLINFNE